MKLLSARGAVTNTAPNVMTQALRTLFGAKMVDNDDLDQMFVVNAPYMAAVTRIDAEVSGEEVRLEIEVPIFYGTDRAPAGAIEVSYHKVGSTPVYLMIDRSYIDAAHRTLDLGFQLLGSLLRWTRLRNIEHALVKTRAHGLYAYAMLGFNYPTHPEFSKAGRRFRENIPEQFQRFLVEFYRISPLNSQFFTEHAGSLPSLAKIAINKLDSEDLPILVGRDFLLSLLEEEVLVELLLTRDNPYYAQAAAALSLTPNISG